MKVADIFFGPCQQHPTALKVEVPHWQVDDAEWGYQSHVGFESLVGMRTFESLV